MTCLFIDRVDDPPEDDRSWTIIRNLQALKELVEKSGYPEPDHVSLQYYFGPDDPGGVEFARWMADNDYLPETFEVHDYDVESQKQEIVDILSPYADYREVASGKKVEAFKDELHKKAEEVFGHLEKGEDISFDGQTVIIDPPNGPLKVDEIGHVLPSEDVRLEEQIIEVDLKDSKCPIDQ